MASSSSSSTPWAVLGSELRERQRPGHAGRLASSEPRPEHWSSCTSGPPPAEGRRSGLGDELAVVAALGEEMLRAGLLEIPTADLRAGNLRGDGQDGHTGAVTVVESVD